MRIERGFYCCYDPLTRLDVRCELCIPGGVVCGALDCEGNVHDVTPDLWRNCVVATFLRSELYDAELVSHSAVPVARYPPLPTPADEARLLGAVSGLYEDGVLPEALEALTVDQSGGVSPEHADVVLHTLLHYFAKRQRWGTAMDFFVRLSATYPTAALYVAAIQRECGLYDEALATLSRAVDEVPNDALLLAGLATEFLYSDQVEASLRYATRAARLRPQLRPAWLALARAHVRGGAGTTALVVLNLVPPPPLPGKEDAMLHVVVAPEPKAVTKPSIPAYDLDVASVRQVLSEEAIVHPAPAAAGAAGAAGALVAGGPPSATATLPGALMVPREPPDAAASPDTAPLRITKAVLAAVYTVLQELVAVSGWDGFLRLRSSVFVMHADSDTLREQQREAEERERQLKLLHRQLSATLPASPGWVPQAPMPGPAPQVVNRRPPPEGLGFESALDEAVVMGLADYPEHLEESYDDPRVIAAREAHRRHLREIAERQAKLEAAEGGAYADDEWDGSSGGGSGGGAGGGPRSATSRSRRKGRKTPGRRAQVAAGVDPGPGDEGGHPEETAATAAAGEGQKVDGAAGEVESAAQWAGPEKPVVQIPVESVVVAVSDSRDPAVLAAAEGKGAVPASNGAGKEGAAEDALLLSTPLPARPQAQAQPQPSASSLGWWGTLFGGGGEAATPAPRQREAGPLGEACEGTGTRRALAPRATGTAPSCRALTAPGSQELRITPTVVRGSWPSPVRNTGSNAAASAAAAVAAGVSATPAWSCLVAQPAAWPATAGPVGPEATTPVGWTWALQAGAVEESWWQPAPAAAQAPADPADPIVCTPLAALRQRAPQRSVSSGPVAGCEASPSCPHPTGLGAPASLLGPCTPQARCSRKGSGGALSPAAEQEQQEEVFTPAPAPLAVAKGLLGLLVCTLKAQADGYRWRWRQRQLQRALLQAMVLEPGLLVYGPRAPLLRLASSRLMGPQAVGSGRSGGRGGSISSNRKLWLRIRTGKLDAVTGQTRPAAGCAFTAPGGTAAPVVLPHLRELQGLHPRRRPLLAWRRPGPGPGPVAEAEVEDEVNAGDPTTLAAVGPSPGGGNGEGGLAPPTDDSFPLVLQNHDTDRQMVLEGLDVTELGAKRLCARWLDELIVALWHDLQAFLDWKALDSELSEAGFRSHAEIVAGIAPGPTPADYQRAAGAATKPAKGEGPDAEGGIGALPPPPALPSLPALEWLRRGLLAERLHHEVDALSAYQAAVMTPPPPPTAAAGGGSAASTFAALPGGGPGAFSMIAWQAILRLAPAGDPRDTAWALRAAQAIMAWLEARAPPGTTAVPFTSGFLSASGAAGVPAGVAARSAPAAAAAAATAAAGGKLHACPLPVVHCLHLVAAVLGDVGVESALQGQPAAGAKGPQTGGGGSAAATGVVHPAAAAVLRYAISTAAAAARSAAAATPTALTATGPASLEAETPAVVGAAV